jgi:hypothetical protein
MIGQLPEAGISPKLPGDNVGVGPHMSARFAASLGGVSAQALLEELERAPALVAHLICELRGVDAPANVGD